MSYRGLGDEPLVTCPPGQVPDIDTNECVPDVGTVTMPALHVTGAPPPAPPAPQPTPSPAATEGADLKFVVIAAVVVGGLAYLIAKQG